MTATPQMTTATAPSGAQAPSGIDAPAFRRAMGALTTGVTVVTTASDDGEMHGMTASAVASLSLDPFLVLVCVRRGTVFDRLVRRIGTFGITVLSEAQREHSGWFASRTRPRGPAQFEPFPWRPGPATGSPLLEGGLTYLDCRLADVHDGGDHVIVLGEVLALGELGGAGPLLHYEGGYRALAAEN